MKFKKLSTYFCDISCYCIVVSNGETVSPENYEWQHRTSLVFLLKRRQVNLGLAS
jgi:hypothetical protein